MKQDSEPQQIASYQDNGYVVIENFLDSHELETWRQVTEAAVALSVAQSPNADGLSEEEKYYNRVFTQCMRLMDIHPGMHELMMDETLGRWAGTLAQVDGIRIWHDQALFKPAYGNPTGWHLDCPYWSFSSRDAISMWVALDDATRDNGCLYYLPGTHKTAHFANYGITNNLGGLFAVYPEWRSIATVGCPCPAGSAVFDNGIVAHGAGANMTNKSRRAMTCAYMPDGAVFNGVENILPAEYAQTLKIGDPIRSDFNPLIWSKE